MMRNNLIEVTFYMESNDYINMREIDKILNIKNAEFYSKGDLFTSPNKKVQFIIEHSYYSFGIDKEENLNEKINKIHFIICSNVIWTFIVRFSCK